MFQYAIQPGDTIYSIANRFNVSIDDLIYANPGLNPYNLALGQIILIPSTYYPRYSVYPILPIPFIRFPMRGFGFGGRGGGRGDGGHGGGSRGGGGGRGRR